MALILLAGVSLCGCSPDGSASAQKPRHPNVVLIVFDEFVPVGAAWYRLFTAEDPGFGFVDDQTPELAIAVVPSRRGRGFGRELLSALLDRARNDGFEAISLSVAKDNPAIHLYEGYGFEKVREDDGAVVMQAALPAEQA